MGGDVPTTPCVEHWTERTARQDLERLIRKEERDKMLKDVVKIINWCYDEGYPEKDPVVQKLMTLEESLRSKQGEP